MRTSFHHQSEAQPPNGPLTAATSPDTPSPGPTTQSDAKRDFPCLQNTPRFARARTLLVVSGEEEGVLRGSLGPSVCGVRQPFPGTR
jgi:hypothetical protein